MAIISDSPKARTFSNSLIESRNHLLSTHFPQLLFVGTFDIVDRITKWYIGCKYNHVAVCWGDGRVFDSRFSGGVGFHPILDYEKADWAILEPTFELSESALLGLKGFFFSCVGMAYDKKDIISFATKRERVANNRFFCSEIINAGFRGQGFSLVPRQIDNRIHPALLYYSWRLKELAFYDSKKKILEIVGK